MPDAPATPTPANAAATPAAPEASSGLPERNAIIAAVDSGKPLEDPAKAKDSAKDTPKPETPKESAVIRSVQRRERELHQKEQALQLRIQQSEANVQAKIEAGIAKALKEQFSDPKNSLAHFQKLGLTPKQIADALVAEANGQNGPSPADIAQKALDEAKAIKESIEREKNQSTYKAREEIFLKEASTLRDNGTLKYLYDEIEEAEILPAAYKLMNDLVAECKAKGTQPPEASNQKILRMLDKRAKQKMDWRQERQKAKDAADPAKKNAGQPDPKADTTKVNGHQGKPTGAPATASLGNGQLNERQTMTVPDPTAMSREDSIAQINKKVSEGFTIKPH